MNTNILAPELWGLEIDPKEQHGHFCKPVGRISLFIIHKPSVLYRTTIDFVSKVTYSRSIACGKVCAVSLYRSVPLLYTPPFPRLLWILILPLLVVCVSCNLLWKRLHRIHPFFIVFLRSLYLPLVHPAAVTTNTLSSGQGPNIIYSMKSIMGARGSVVDWGTMLQAGRPRVRFPVRSLDFFFNWPNTSSHTMDLVSTQPLAEMSTRNLPGGGKGRPARKSDNLTTICEPIV
jgi:hypothetical protein